MSNISKTQKTLLIIASSIILLILAFYIFLNYWANYRLPEILGDKVKSKNIDVRIIGNEARFDKPSLVLDSTNSEDDFKLEASAGYILIDGFNIWDLLFSNEIEVANFEVDSLQVMMIMPEDKPSQSQQKQVNLFVQDIFSQINVKHFQIGSANFLFKKEENKDTLYSVAEFNLTADGIVVDTATIDRPFPLHFDSSKVNIGKVFFRLANDYVLTASGIGVSDTNLVVKDLRFTSLLSKEEFVAAHKYEKARIDLSVDSIVVTKLLWDIRKSFELDASKIELNQMDLEIFKDKNPPLEPPASIPLLAGRIKELPFLLTVDTLRIRDSSIELELKAQGADSAGVVTFEKLYASAYNISNDTARFSKHPVTTLDILAQVMGAGELNGKIELLLQSTDGSFRASGTLGEMDVSEFNRALLPLAGAKVSGQAHELSFDFEGNNKNSSGTLNFYYEDFDIKLMEKNEADKAWLKSMLGNLVLRDKNKPEDEKDGEIYFVRYQNKGFWNYLWHSIRIGLVDVVVPVYSPGDKERLLEDQPRFDESE